MGRSTTRAEEAAEELALQLEWHWEAQARPRLAGLTDEEYFWEPAPGAWSLRPRGSAAAGEIGAGAFVLDYQFPEPAPAPVTTIAWRLAHLLVGVFGDRNARYFNGPPVTYGSYDYPATATEALRRLDQALAVWFTGVRSMGPGGLAERCREPGFESDSMGALVLHINREAIHHLAEIALLRDLFPFRAHGVVSGERNGDWA